MDLTQEQSDLLCQVCQAPSKFMAFAAPPVRKDHAHLAAGTDSCL